MLFGIFLQSLSPYIHLFVLRDEVYPLVNRVSGSAARRIGSRDEALAAYTRAYNAGHVFCR